MLAPSPHRVWQMPRRFVTHHDRWVFLSIGTWATVIGFLFEMDHTADRQVWIEPVWNVLFIVGGLVAIAFAFDLSSWLLRALSNALIVVACAGRGAGFLLALGKLAGWIDGGSDIDSSWQRALAGIAVWSMLAFALYVVWRSRLPGGVSRDGP